MVSCGVSELEFEHHSNAKPADSNCRRLTRTLYYPSKSQSIYQSKSPIATRTQSAYCVGYRNVSGLSVDSSVPQIPGLAPTTASLSRAEQTVNTIKLRDASESGFKTKPVWNERTRLVMQRFLPMTTCGRKSPEHDSNFRRQDRQALGSESQSRYQTTRVHSRLVLEVRAAWNTETSTDFVLTHTFL